MREQKAYGLEQGPLWRANQEDTSLVCGWSSDATWAEAPSTKEVSIFYNSIMPTREKKITWIFSLTSDISF